MSRRAVWLLIVAGITMACLPTVGTPTPTPTVELPSPTPTAEISPTPSVCIPQAAYVADITIPDGTPVDPGVSFTKTWRVRVDEDCGGPFPAELIYDGGADLNGPPTTPVTMPAEGGEVDVSVQLIAPQEPSTYRAYWRFRTQEGIIFGPRLYVEIVVPSPTVTPTVVPAPQPALAMLWAQKDAWLFTLEGTPYPSPIVDPDDLPAFPEEGPAQAMGDTLYYLSGGSIWSASLDGTVEEVFALPESTSHVQGFLISPDHRWLALALEERMESGIAPTLTVIPLDGGLPVAVEPATAETDHAYMPLAWTPEGDLIYAHTPWGIGGYILFGGYLSLHRWDGSTSHVLFDPTATYSFCIYTLSPDRTLVAHSCNPPSPPNLQMKIYNLRTLTEVVIPMMADQGQMGAAYFSPSGQWLAYSAARGDPDREAGSVVIVPSDGSTSPDVIYHTEGGYVAVRGWVDEDWLVVQRHTGMGEHWDLLLMSRDGDTVRLLASDAYFLGVLQP